MTEGNDGFMQTFNDSEFSLLGNDGIRMFFDMKGSGSLCFKVTDRQAHDLFCREMGIRPDDSVSPDFAMEFFSPALVGSVWTKCLAEER